MPARSRAQQALFAIAANNPGALNAKNAALGQLPAKTLHDFAATPTKGLPQHVKPVKPTRVTSGVTKMRVRPR